jgi:hypothetical protein
MRAYTLKQDGLGTQVRAVVQGAFYALGAPQAFYYKPIRCFMRQGLLLANNARIQADLYFQFYMFPFVGYFLGFCGPGKCPSTEIKSCFMREFKPGFVPNMYEDIALGIKARFTRGIKPRFAL